MRKCLKWVSVNRRENMQHNPTWTFFLYKTESLDEILMEMILSSFNRHRLQSHLHTNTCSDSIAFWMHFSYFRNLCLNFNAHDKISKQWFYKMATVGELRKTFSSFFLQKLWLHLKFYCLLRVAFYCQQFILQQLDLFKLYKIFFSHKYNKTRTLNITKRII